jgi:hypothetical protein
MAKLGIILFTSSAIVQPNVTPTQPPISPSEIAQTFLSTPVQEILMPQMEPIELLSRHLAKGAKGAKHSNARAYI